MAISIRATGTYVFGTAAITVGIPAGTVAGDMMLLFYSTKPFGDVPTIDNTSGWVELGSATDGTVNAGIDVGSMRTSVFYKEHTGSETTPIVTNTTNNVSGGIIISFQKSAQETWLLQGSGGGDATANTTFSVTGGSNFNLRVGDFLVGYAGLRSDAATQSAITITASGATVAAFTEPVADGTTTSGGDMAMSGGYTNVTAGTVTAAPVYASTLAASHTGSAYIVRLRAQKMVLAESGNYHSAQIRQLGNALSIASAAHIAGLDGSSIAMISNAALTKYNFGGTNWAVDGSALSGSYSTPKIGRLTSTSVGVSSGTSLTAYSFSGGSWSPQGSAFTLPSSLSSMCGLSENTIVAGAGNPLTLYTYTFNGSTWSLVGSSFNTGVTTGGTVYIAALSSTRIAVYIQGGQLALFDFNGSTWSAVSGLSTTATELAGVTSSIAAVDSTSVIGSVASTDLLIRYKLGNNLWARNSQLSIASINTSYMSQLSPGVVAMWDNGTTSLRTILVGDFAEFVKSSPPGQILRNAQFLQFF